MWLRWMEMMLVRAPADGAGSEGADPPAAGGGSPDTPPVAPIESTLLTDAATAPAEDPAADPAKPAEPEKPADPVEMKPEDYKLELPEGWPAEDPVLQKFLVGAAKGGMDNESVQAIVSELGPALKEQMLAPYQAWQDMNKQWAADVAAHPEIGGANQATAMATIVKAMDRFVPAGEAGAQERADLRHALITTGAGNNPHILAWAHRMAKQLLEPTAPVLGNSANPPKDPLRGMYPTHYQNG
jgi:hypothetical protein